jgi:prolyl oligopeptidase
MKRTALWLFPVLMFVACTAPQANRTESHAQPFKYPTTHKIDHVDDYHGTSIADPYRWLEDPNATDTKTWVKAQNAVTFGYLKSLKPRDAIRKRLTELWNYERFGTRGYATPFKKGGQYFYFRNDGLQNQDVLYTMQSLNDEPRVLLDPNKLSSDGTIALSGVAVSPDGKHLAYGVSSGGSDWQEWHVRDVANGRDLSDHVRWVKFSQASWSKDGQGFYYSRYDAPAEGEKLHGQNHFQKLYYHTLGKTQDNDQLVYERPDQKEWGFGGEVTDDGRYLMITVWRGTERKNLVFFKDLAAAQNPVVELISDFEASYTFVGNDGSTLWIQTDLNAPTHRLIALDAANPHTAPREIIPATGETLTAVSRVGGHFTASYLKDAHSQVKVFDLNGRMIRDVNLPGIGSVSGFEGGADSAETFFAFSSFNEPASIYRYNVADGGQSLFKKPKVAFDSKKFITKQIFYSSKDGTRVPMFIVHKQGLKLDGDNRVLLYGYGGFNISLTPRFSVANIVWMERGGVYAMPNLRGGGEYGRAWHEAGMKHHKQNVFDDFIAAGEWLVKNKYTQPSKLAIAGGSNGGLLVGACMTQRPDLFGAAMPAVGVMDMLRFHKFTIGWAWVSDFGSPEDPADFKVLQAYSPLHNLRAGVDYPATLITTADHDDRVVPAHSFKFAAALQSAHAGQAPTLIRIETRAGHGAGKPTAMVIEEATDKWAFLEANLN